MLNAHARADASSLSKDPSIEHHSTLRVTGTIATERLDGRQRLPALEDVDATGIHQVRADGEVQAAGCPAGQLDDAHAVRQIAFTLLRLDDDMPRGDHHSSLLCQART
ncbi:hypothetical protein GCM10009734_09360 [Nonomuraea bangladeshensis]